MGKDENLEDQCPNSPDEKHVPDWQTAAVIHEGNMMYLDVNCRHCGCCGCAGTSGTLSDSINW